MSAISKSVPQLVPVVLSGGTGSRLWPLSRTSRPKQFLALTEERSLFQLTLDRLKLLLESDEIAPIVVANDNHRFLAAEQCRSVGVRPQHLILEPVGRNTAPAIAIAAFAAMDDGSDPILFVLPSDHLFSEPAALAEAIQAALPSAEAGQLVIFGITPTSPETGFGYIRSASILNSEQAVPVVQFIEKPDLVMAKMFIADRHYMWNSGMFLMRASAYLVELKRLQPKMYLACEQAWQGKEKDLDFTRIERVAFENCPSESVDFAVMEKTNKAAAISLNAGWKDVGAWPSVWQAMDKDENGNATRGDAVLHESRNCLVYAEKRLVSLVGVSDLVVIETSDSILVLQNDQAQDVRKVVDLLKAQGRPEVDSHSEVFRPWGSYDSIYRGSSFLVKRITVLPGEKLSLQMHHHRAEHWVVVSGTALIRIGEKESIITENQSVYIPIGVIHSLENPGDSPLEIIEVQSGSYLGEDDIVRLEDRYGRA